MPDHRIFPEHTVPALFKEGSGGERSVRRNARGAAPDGVPLQTLRNAGSNAAALVIPMDIEPVEIAAGVDVAEAGDHAVGFRDDGEMRGQRARPCVRVDAAGRPGVELRRGVIRGVDRVNGIVKQPDERRRVRGVKRV